MAWPNATTVRAARLGTVAEVIRIPEGFIKGLRSSTPHVWAQVAATGAVAGCEHCGAREPEPSPPASMAPGAPRTSLMAPGTAAHATYLLTWLYRFERAHEECKDKTAEASV